MIINADGVTKLNANTGSSVSVVYVSGDLGGGVGTLGYTNGSAEFVPLTDGAVEIGGQYQVNHGGGQNIFLELVGSSAAALDVVMFPLN